MISRVDKYNKNNQNLSRSMKNKDLYDEVYADTNYSNMVVIDDSNEIDISKIKEIIDNEKKKERTYKEERKITDIYDGVPVLEEEKPKKTYDINEVLREAKSKRDIIEDAGEKRKIQNYNFKTNEELEAELAKTRQVYENLVKEEKELLNIMNTLTNVSDKDLALDMFSDLKPTDDTIVTKPVNSNENTVNVRQITNDDDSKEYSTDTFMFDTKDFEGVKHIRNDVKKTSAFIKVLIFILSTVFVLALAFIVYKYVLK